MKKGYGLKIYTVNGEYIQEYEDKESADYDYETLKDISNKAIFVGNTGDEYLTLKNDANTSFTFIRHIVRVVKMYG